jgi:hypothetical protein
MHACRLFQGFFQPLWYRRSGESWCSAGMYACVCIHACIYSSRPPEWNLGAQQVCVYVCVCMHVYQCYFSTHTCMYTCTEYLQAPRWLHAQDQTQVFSHKCMYECTHTFISHRHHADQLPAHAQDRAILTHNGLEERWLVCMHACSYIYTCIHIHIHTAILTCWIRYYSHISRISHVLQCI